MALFRLRGRKRSEEHLPNLLRDLTWMGETFLVKSLEERIYKIEFIYNSTV